MLTPPSADAKRVFHGIIHDVWQWEQERFDASMASYECITRPDTAAVIPFLDKETILLTRQEQSGRTPFMDVPGGRVEIGENASEAVIRELLEETGYRAGSVKSIQTNELMGTVRYTRHVFLACNLTRDLQPAHPDAGERITVVPTRWSDAVRMCLKHELRGADAMLAILAMEFDPEARALRERFLAS